MEMEKIIKLTQNSKKSKFQKYWQVCLQYWSCFWYTFLPLPKRKKSKNNKLLVSFFLKINPLAHSIDTYLSNYVCTFYQHFAHKKSVKSSLTSHYYLFIVLFLIFMESWSVKCKFSPGKVDQIFITILWNAFKGD